MTDGERDPAEPTRPRLRELGTKIRAAMGSMSERELARKAGVSAQTVSNMLRGHLAGKPDGNWRPTAPNVIAVASALPKDTVTVAEALQLADYDPNDYITPVEVGQPLMSETALASKIAHLGPEKRRALETIVDGLLREKGYIDESTPVASHGEVARSGVRSHGERVKGDGEQMPKQERARD